MEFQATGRLHPQTQTDVFAAATVKYPGNLIAELSCGTTVMHDISARIYGTKGWLDVPVPFFPRRGRQDRQIFPAPA